MQKRQRQDGYLNDADKEKMEVTKKNCCQSNNDDDNSVPWTTNNDILYSLLCITFY